MLLRKKSLQPVCGVTRFRQRLLHNDFSLEDDARLRRSPKQQSLDSLNP